MAKQTVTPGEGELVQLDPALIRPGTNIRYSLKPERIEQMKASIMAQGGVQTPVEVTPLQGKDADGHAYELNFGGYRLEAVLQLNSKDNAGFLIPAIIKPVTDPVERFRRQVAENMDRENQTPIDLAVAIKQAFDMGIPRPEIRKMFPRPGGRKGTEMRPASNSFINMTLGFLELAKPIRDKIQSGEIGVAAAYEIGKLPADKQKAVVDRCLAERAKEAEAEEKAEEKFLAEERKVAEAKEKEAAAEKELAEAQAAMATASETINKAADAATEAYAKLQKGAKDAKEKEKLEKELKAAEAAKKEAVKAEEAARKSLEKLQGKVKTAAEHAKERADKLKVARETAKAKNVPKGKAKPVGPADVKKSAKAEGVETAGKVPLKLKEILEAVNDWSLPGSYPKAQSIGKVLQSCFSGGLTPNEAYHELAKITGERKAK